MPTLTLQIDNPKITPSPVYPYFKVRYRVKGTTIWTLDTNQRTNAAYNRLFSDTPQIWEMEVTLVTGEGVECEPVIYEIEVKAACNCLSDVTHSVASTHGYNIMTISYTLPSPQPACGWVIAIINSSGNRRRINYSSLPSGSIKVTLNDGDVSVEIFANCCDEASSSFG